KTSIFSHPVYLFLRKFSLQDSRGGSHCCSDGYIGKRLQKAEGIIEGMLMALDIRLDMDIVANNSN
ncbi:antiterminator Q family protein, partial [Escherichia coli]|uniref:antiterminator Q family protein n=1 Tax=Escherichia coli TaxID=562 RepID=UPI002552C991